MRELKPCPCDKQVVDYGLADAMLKLKLKSLMWLSRYGKYDSTSPYIPDRHTESTHAPQQEGE